MNPTEHDERLLALLNTQAILAHRRDSYAGCIMQVTDTRPRSEQYRNYKRVPDPRPLHEALVTMEAAVENPEASSDPYHAKYTWPDYLARFNEAREAAGRAAADVTAHEANYTGWDRFWLVTSSPGHVHRSRNCQSCTWKTTYALVPFLSAQTEAEAVETFGAAMCSVCFPSAPTGVKIGKALAESVGTESFAKQLAKHQAKNGVTA